MEGRKMIEITLKIKISENVKTTQKETNSDIEKLINLLTQIKNNLSK